MHYTQHIQLPQWVETDRIMMEDFNQMCEDIESGLTSNAQAAAAAKPARKAETEKKPVEKKEEAKTAASGNGPSKKSVRKSRRNRR